MARENISPLQASLLRQAVLVARQALAQLRGRALAARAAPPDITKRVLALRLVQLVRVDFTRTREQNLVSQQAPLAATFTST